MEADIDSPKQGSGAEQLGFPVRRVPLDAPWDWLSRGWRDLCTVPTELIQRAAEKVSEVGHKIADKTSNLIQKTSESGSEVGQKIAEKVSI